MQAGGIIVVDKDKRDRNEPPAQVFTDIGWMLAVSIGAIGDDAAMGQI